MARKLKVFRTAAGFHDAYVAAPSRKAALAAWGADADLFARGVAEEVTDPALTAAPLKQPGEVVRVSRGSAAEQLAEAAKGTPRRVRAKSPASDTAAPPRAKRAPPPKPKPSRDRLTHAEDALSQAEDEYQIAEKALAAEQRALDRRRRDAAAAHERARARLTQVVEDERVSYDAALERWRR